MPKIICMVPEQAFSNERLLSLESALRSTYAGQFGTDESVMVLWYRLPAGQSFVAGSMGDVFIATVEVEDGTVQEKREEALMAFTRTLSEGAGIGFDKPLVSVLDSSKVSEYLKANRTRLRWGSRLGFLLGTLAHAYRSRRRDGFMSVRANL